MKYLSILFLLLFIFISCEDVIDVDSGFEESQIVIDAWITNQSSTQIITLTESQDYFDNRLPTPIENALVTVTNGSVIHQFEDVGDGKYSWTPGMNQTIGDVGNTMVLNVAVGEKSYIAQTEIDPVPEIDSIKIFFEDQVIGVDEEELFAELYARDLPGVGNTYWVKSYKNDTLLNRPLELNLIYDATFEAGTNLDGVTFIRPLRFAVNALDDNGIPQSLNLGDKVRCEIYSISYEAFQFLQIVKEQATNGDSGIFARPIANSKGNIYNISTEERVLGIFNVAEMSAMEKIVE
ncbi:MAG: DUF4249 domain-containing protein [Saprospiraceae bacterium]